jgi:hypothetical protein
MRKKAKQSKPDPPKVRRKPRRTSVAATKALRETNARSLESTALRLVLLDANRAHLSVNRTPSLATALKILEVLRQDHAGAD